MQCYAEGAARRHDVGDGHVAVHGGLGRAPPRRSASGPRSCPTSPTCRATTTSRRSSRTVALLEDATATAADGRVRTWVGLEHLFYCTPEAFRGAAELAEEFDTGIHTHSSESIWEVQESLKRFGRRPIEEFYNRGILGDAHRRRALRVARRPRDRAARPDRHVGRALPVLEHEARVGAGARSATSARAGVDVGLGQRRREGEQQPRPPRGDEVRVAAAEGDDARPDRRRPVGRPRHGHAGRGRGRSGSTTITGSLDAGQAGRRRHGRPRRLHTTPVLHGARLQRRRPPRVLGRRVTTCDDVWVDGRLLVDGGAAARRSTSRRCGTQAQAAAEELFERRRALEDLKDLKDPKETSA